MAATRLLRMSAPLGFDVSNYDIVTRPRRTVISCLNKADWPENSTGERKPVAVKATTGFCSAYAVVSEPKIDKVPMLAYVSHALIHWKKLFIQQTSWERFNIQMFLEKTIMDCRFFTLLAVGGSLICSLLCYFQGCLLVVGSYMQYFHAISRMLDQGQVVHLLIEAIDMFIMGTAMLVFAMALYVMFVGQNSHIISKDSALSFQEAGCAMEAKSRIGHAVMLILQGQVLDKFRSIGVSNGMDLACFAGAIFLSSASIFILSRTSTATPPT